MRPWLLRLLGATFVLCRKPDPHDQDPVAGSNVAGLQPTQRSCNPGTVGDERVAARNITSAVLMLVDFDRIESRLHFMEPQLQNFAKMQWLKSYCVYYLYEGDPSAWKAKTKDFPVCIRFIDVSCLFQPPEEARKNRYTAEVAKDMTKERVGYRTMCLFWSSLIFKIPAIARLESYLRLDTDSIFFSEADVFQHFHTSPNVYGYFRFAWDNPCVSQGLCAVAKKFIADTALEHHVPQNISLDTNSAPGFSTNFELVKLSHFHRADVQAFTQRVVDAGGIFIHRWGDAIIRCLQILLFTGAMECYHEDWPGGGFFYRHKHGEGLSRKRYCPLHGLRDMPNGNVLLKNDDLSRCLLREQWRPI